MRVWGSVIALAVAGCAGRAPAPEAPVQAMDGKEYVDRLKVETTYHRAPQGAECSTSFIELPQGAYVAQGWWHNACRDWRGYRSWDPCERRYRSRRDPCDD